LLTRPLEQMQGLADRLREPLASALGPDWRVDIEAVKSQVGSGSMPVETLPSVALSIIPNKARAGSALNALAKRLRSLPIPVVGRVVDNKLQLDLRCLEDETAFAAQLPRLQA
jgi:L-seryl-tRNA(Ser) seleniumtransferase